MATTEEALNSWVDLNTALKDATEERAKQLLEAEKAGRRRPQFLLRIHGRLNKVRAERERLEILKFVSNPKAARRAS